MYELIVLNGFLNRHTIEDIFKFIEKTPIKDFDLFISVKCQGIPETFDGTVYMIVKSLFDVSSLLRLHGTVYDGVRINIKKSQFNELDNKILYPQPLDKFYQLIYPSNQTNSSTPSTTNSNEHKKRIQPPDTSIQNNVYKNHASTNNTHNNIYRNQLSTPIRNNIYKSQPQTPTFNNNMYKNQSQTSTFNNNMYKNQSQTPTYSNNTYKNQPPTPIHNNNMYRNQPPTPIRNNIYKSQSSNFTRSNNECIKRIYPSNNTYNENRNYQSPITNTSNEYLSRNNLSATTNNNELNDISHKNFVKIVYDKIIDFGQFNDFICSNCIPIKIYYPKYGFGPHAKLYRLEVFVQFADRLDAKRFLSLNIRSFQSSHLFIVPANVYDVQTILYENSSQIHQSPSSLISDNYTKNHIITNQIMSYAHNTVSDHTHNTISDHARNTTPDHTRNTTPDHTRNTISDHARNTIPDHTRNTLPDHTRNTLPDHTRNTISDHTRNTIPDHACNTIPDHACNTIPDHACNTIPDHIHNTIHDHTRNTIPDHACNTIPIHPCNTLPDNTHNTLSDHAHNTISDHTHNTISDDSNTSLFNYTHHTSSPIKCNNTTIKLITSENIVTSKDIEIFFKNFNIIKSSIIKIKTENNIHEWNLSFKSINDAKNAIYTLNYEFLLTKPVELYILD